MNGLPDIRLRKGSLCYVCAVFTVRQGGRNVLVGAGQEEDVIVEAQGRQMETNELAPGVRRPLMRKGIISHPRSCPARTVKLMPEYLWYILSSS